MYFKNNLTPSQLEYYLTNYMVVVKSILPNNYFQLKLYQYGDGEFSYDTEVCVEFQGTSEHFAVLEAHNIKI